MQKPFKNRRFAPVAALCLLVLVLFALSSTTGCARARLTGFEQGVEFMDYGDYPRAIEQFKEIGRRDGYSLEICYNLGVCYHDMENWDEAVIWYEQALEYDPRDGDTLVNLGLVYLEQGRDVAALARLKQAADVEKDRAYPLVAMALYYQRTGELDKSRELYDEALKREQKSGYLWYHYGTLHEQDQRWGDAAQAYERSTEFDGTNPAAFEGAARAYFRLRNWRKAVQFYDFAIHLLPDQPHLYLGAADALIELERYERAVKYLWAARGLTSQDDPEVRKRLLMLYPLLLEAELEGAAEKPEEASGDKAPDDSDE